MSVLTHSTAPATDRQLSYLGSLAKERNWSHLDGNVFERIFDVATGSGKFISKHEASAAINALLHCPTEEVVDEDTGEVLAPATEEGMYRVSDGTVYRVKRAKSSGNLYAEEAQLVQVGVKDDGEPRYKATFEWKPRLIKLLTARDRLSLEEAKRLGKLWEFCIVCGAELTDPKSIDAGIGPVCGGRV